MEEHYAETEKHWDPSTIQKETEKAEDVTEAMSPSPALTEGPTALTSINHGWATTQWRPLIPAESQCTTENNPNQGSFCWMEFDDLCQKISLSRRTSFTLSVSKWSFLICSIIVMVILLSQLWVRVLCKKVSASSQLLTPFLTSFLRLFNRRLNIVSLLPILQMLHSIM